MRLASTWFLPPPFWPAPALAQPPVTVSSNTQSSAYAIPADFCSLSFETMTLSIANQLFTIQPSNAQYFYRVKFAYR